MASKTVVLIIYQDYPFDSIQQRNSKTAVQVKKSLQYGKEPRFIIKEKIRMVKNLGFQHLIGLQSTAEEEDMINLYYQYVQHSFQTVFKTLQDPEIANKIKEDMISLAENLANHCIDHEFKMNNIGLDKRNNLKYYLGLNFKIDRTMQKQKLIQKYRQAVQSIFACTTSTYVKSGKYGRNQYYQTMDTTKVNNFQDQSNKCQNTLMKKSVTLQNNNMIQTQHNSQKDLIKSRFTFDGVDELIETNQQNNFDEEQKAQIKPIKMQELGARINKLKYFMKEVTGKTPKNNEGISKFTVKIDENNSENKIYQQNKIMITPNFTKFQNKIAEFKQSKLYRAYNEREILYSKNNQGYQLNTIHNLQKNSLDQNNNQKQDPPKSPKGTLKLNQDNKKVHVPNYLLQRKQIANGQSKDNSLIKSRNFQKEQDPHQKQYRMLAEKDKYCEQFLFFLEDQNQQKPSKTPNTLREYDNISRVKERISQNLSNSIGQNAREIQDRVKNAIRNSLKLITNLKTRQPTQF